MRKVPKVLPLVILITLLASGRADAALTVFETFTGTVAVSTDGFGSITPSGTISASVPAGATVLAAFLYSSTFQTHNPGGTLNGTAVTYGAPVVNPTIASGYLAAARADVTSIVAPIINGGPGGTYNFSITETSGTQDGEALVVVYSLPSLPVATVGILDGFSSAGGDSFAINFSDPLDPTDPDFFAEMRLGIGFSAGGNQFSNVTVNGTLISGAAGGFDDGALANGALITVGGFDDPFSPLLPSQADDHERYSLLAQIQNGDTTISVGTNNPSNDDNIFLAVFYVGGVAGINEPPPDSEPPPVPEPMTLAMLGLGAVGLGVRRMRRQS